MAIQTATGAIDPRPESSAQGRRRAVLASSLGTAFEWYDFYLYGALAGVIGDNFFSMYDEGTRGVFALLAFAAGFLVRPFGALFFGRLGDLVGRKYTFLVTIILMGAATFLVGLLPTAGAIGIAAPILLLLLRLAQGFALGGEYGGAVTYVAEHAPQDRRGLYTGFVQVTATAGLLLSLVVILATRAALGEAAFADWGWRIPFLLSAVLLAISVWIRARLEESPAFLRMKREGTHSKAPIAEAFLRWRNARVALIALFGLAAGQGVVWYTGQFYALFFLGQVLRVDGFTQDVLVAWALLLGSGGFVLFGWLSDRVGRKPIILGGCLLAALTYFPLFGLMSRVANPALDEAHRTIPVQLVVDREGCSLPFDPAGTARLTRPCDVAREALARASVAYTVEDGGAPDGTAAAVRIASGPPIRADRPAFAQELQAALAAAGYPAAANPTVVRISSALDVFRPQPAALIGVLTLLVLYVAMVYGPIAAALVELFPTRIRYTSLSLPYHIGNGWFGGMLPATAFAMAAQTGDPHFGLWYPVAVALMSAAAGLVLLPETRHRDIFAPDLARRPRA
jgi:Sugar (and other) transporter